MKENHVIKVRNLTKVYGDKTVLNNLSFNITKGKVIGIVGPNGSGKTTLIESIEGLRKIDMGSIEVLGKDVFSNYKEIQADIGIQLQSTSLFGNLTVQETLELYCSLYEKPVDIVKMLNEVNLINERGKKIIHLSGGQYQRFNLCIAILNNPQILFLDEPTTGLDPHARRLLWEIIKKQVQQGSTIILTTHYMDEAQEVCDEIIILHNGNIIIQDTPLNLINKLNHEKVIIIELKNELSEELIKEILKVQKIRKIDNFIYIYDKDIERSFRTMFDWANKTDSEILNISIRTPNLDDVFVKYTSTTIK